MKKEKIILDTNLWLSFLISDKLALIEEVIDNGNFELLLSEHLLHEIETVIKRPKFKKYFSDKSIALLFDFFAQKGNIQNVSSNLTICRDEKDNFLLNLSIDGNANYLITGDKDLLVLSQIEKTKIITITDFLKINQTNN